MGKDKEKAVCCHCEKQFTKTSNMYQHIREVHGVEPVNFGRLKCPGCGSNFPNYECIRNHITKQHNVKCELEEHLFSNEKDFYEWKRKIEDEGKGFYVRNTSPKVSAAKENTYYYICHRSGHCKSRATGKRNLKIESNKMSGNCPSTMMVKVSKHVNVIYCPTHFGHDASTGRERRHAKDQGSLEKKERREDRINEGSKSSLQKVLDEVQHGTEEFERIQQLTKKDVLSIKKDLCLLPTEQSHENEAFSVRLWVDSMSQLAENNPIIFYKDQGAADMTGFLNEQDFCLIIMTRLQQKMLTEFCNPKICIDSTHGTNANDYYLTTMLTVDEFDVGCPVAFCICNRTDIEVINFFFNYIRSKVGVINTNVFMSDDAPEFYNAWEVVMGPTQHYLLCTWLVDKNWRKNLAKINSRFKKITVYKTLRVLLKEPNLQSFTEMERNFVKLLEDDPDTRKFKKYYSTYYSERLQLWAFCYRRHLGIQTNIYLESFHKVLKHIYLEGKKIKRIDKTLNALMKLTKDKIFEKISNIAKKVPITLSNVNQVDVQNSLISSEMIIPVNGNAEWNVTASQESSFHYIVREVTEPICSTCKCSPLYLESICVHKYECTCYDNLINCNICEHIQACLKFKNLNPKQPAEFVNNAEPSKEQNSVLGNPDLQKECDKKLILLKEELASTKMSKNAYLKINSLLDRCLTLCKENNEIKAVVSSLL
ncbi:uncharacterized protein LOC129985173 [Argiope bruennichi]|uniref:C2H2-type domain-containing protein n=1 Tax=Argiope bruennichi TaxID=94029 RepID=A0A8T0EL52_ARGBR|nr:uncharacterized protein LOC129985173 [Argiope bruennichi]KAF8774308.1 hypothetical protein HNY73_016873 [Argiope bruennichi]